MGTSIYIVLGYVNKKEMIYLPGSKNINLTALTEIGNKFSELTCDDITIVDYDDNENIPKVYRNYNLFSWLCGVGGKIKPFKVNSPDELINFRKLCHNFYDTLLSCKGIDDILYADYGYGVFTIAELVNFDYDQVAVEIHSDDDYLIWVPKLVDNDSTYRDLLREGDWFEFLDACVKEGVDFIIVGFD